MSKPTKAAIAMLRAVYIHGDCGRNIESNSAFFRESKSIDYLKSNGFFREVYGKCKGCGVECPDGMCRNYGCEKPIVESRDEITGKGCSVLLEAGAVPKPGEYR
jgi:hypothetical protein